MRTHYRAIRRTVSPILASVMLVLSVAVPVLDTERTMAGPVFESEHTRGECVVGHDHTVCTHAGASRALPSAETRPPLPALRETEPAGRPGNPLHHLLASTGHSPRAPPLA